jgi:hypothetical protein
MLDLILLIFLLFKETAKKKKREKRNFPKAAPLCFPVHELLVSPHPSHHLALLACWILAIKIGRLWHLACDFLNDVLRAPFHMVFCHLYTFCGKVF